MSRPSAAWLSLLVLFGGCREAETRTQTIVMIDGTPQAKAAITRVGITSTSLDDGTSRDLSSDGTWPIKLVFAPKNEDASRRFKIELSARGDDGRELVALSLTTGFVARSARYASIIIDDGCADHAHSSCADAGCNTSEVDAAELGKSVARPWMLTLKCAGPAEVVPPPDVTAQNNRPPDDAGTTTVTMAMDASPGDKAGGHPAVMMATAGNAGSTMPPLVQAGSSGGGPTMVGPCNTGYELRNGDCSDIDECASSQPCAMHGSCENTPGSYVCHCEPGYAGDLGPCVNVDECANGTAGCAGTCTDDEGSFHCACPESSWLKADGKGCTRFGKAEKIGLTSSAVMTMPQVAVDDSGKGLAVWVQGDMDSTALWTNRYTPGAGWGVPSKLPTSGNVETPRVVLDGMGRGLVVWVQAGPNHKDLWGIRYASDAFVSVPMSLESEDAGDVSSPKLALDASGNGFVIWTYFNGSRTEIWANRWIAAPAHFIGAGRVVGNENVGVASAEISLDASGAGNLVWTQFNITDGSADLHFAPWTQRYDPAKTWVWPPLLLDVTSDSAGLPDVQLEAHGSGNVVWRRVNADGGSIVARRFDGTSLAPLKTIATSVLTQQAAYAVNAWQPHVASSPAGNSAAVWSDTTDGNRVVGSTRQNSTSEWTAATSLSPAVSMQFTPSQVALDADGYGFAVWTDYPAANTRVIRAQRVQPDRFGGAIDLDSDLTPSAASPLRFALDAQGSGLVIWDRQNSAMQYEVWGAKLE